MRICIATLVATLTAATISTTATATAGQSAATQEVSFALPSAASISALQLAIRYDPDTGAFVGRGPAVDCRANPDLPALFAFNLCDPAAPDGCRDTARLNVGMISPEPIVGPVILFRCRFTGAPTALVPPTFAVDVTESGATIAGRVANRPVSIDVVTAFAAEGN